MPGAHCNLEHGLSADAPLQPCGSSIHAQLPGLGRGCGAPIAPRTAPPCHDGGALLSPRGLAQRFGQMVVDLACEGGRGASWQASADALHHPAQVADQPGAAADQDVAATDEGQVRRVRPPKSSPIV